jgi:hypothetical protein
VLEQSTAVVVRLDMLLAQGEQGGALHTRRTPGPGRPRVWSVRWSPISRGRLRGLLMHFDAHRETRPFRWTPPGESVSVAAVYDGQPVWSLAGARGVAEVTIRESFTSEV